MYIAKAVDYLKMRVNQKSVAGVHVSSFSCMSFTNHQENQPFSSIPKTKPLKNKSSIKRSVEKSLQMSDFKF